MIFTNFIITIILSNLKSTPANTMDSPVEFSFIRDKKCFDPPRVCDLSPITNLTLNLSGLSTSVAGSPIGRISWSSPVPCGSKFRLNAENISNDSPTFQDIFPRRSRVKHKAVKRKTRNIPSDSEEEKENIIPSDDYFETLSKTSEENIRSSSQDSGYGGVSETCFDSPSSSQTISSDYFTNEDDQDFGKIFNLDELEDIGKIIPVPEGMVNLLNDPLLEKSKSPRIRSDRFNIRYSNKKFPTRRCLSLDLDGETDPSATTNNNQEIKFPVIYSQTLPTSQLDESDKPIFKRPEPPNELPNFNKRRKSCATVEPYSGNNRNEENFKFHRSYSETAATIMHALLKADLQPDLVGDGSRCYALPLVKGRHQDLKSISPQTLVELMKGDYNHKIDNFTLIDCRYPYEFEGGHIHGAKNIYTKEDIMSTFFESSGDNYQKSALIFHCEFSSERAPTLCRFLRNKDREANEGNYPRLNHPEIYLLEGGYKAFYESHKELCEPQNYKPMNHKDHGFELRHFRAKSKSWGADSKGRPKLRSHSKQTFI